MYHRFALVALLLPLSGCYVPGPYGYAPAGYPPPGYPAPYAQPDYAYPGYAYNDGSPTLYADGATWPLVFWGGGWGYWDGYHRWHGAPSGVWHDLDRRHPGGVGYHPAGGGNFGRPSGLAGGGNFGRPSGPAGGPRPSGPPPGVRPATTASAPHTTGGHPSGERRDEHH